MSMRECTDTRLSGVFETYRAGGEVVVTLTDGSRHVIDYATSDDYVSGHAEGHEDEPRFKACAALEARFEKHKKECPACTERWSPEYILTKLMGNRPS